MKIEYSKEVEEYKEKYRAMEIKYKELISRIIRKLRDGPTAAGGGGGLPLGQELKTREREQRPDQGKCKFQKNSQKHPFTGAGDWKRAKQGEKRK